MKVLSKTSDPWLFSDPHIGHQKTIQWRSRLDGTKFNDVEEHDQYIINQINETVPEGSTLILLGDVVFGIKNAYKLAYIKPKMHLVMGNHDNYNIDYLQYFERVHGILTHKTKDKNIAMSHIPVWNGEFTRNGGRFDLNIHGHLHEKEFTGSDTDLYRNACCEQVGYAPKPLEWFL